MLHSNLVKASNYLFKKLKLVQHATTVKINLRDFDLCFSYLAT